MESESNHRPPLTKSKCARLYFRPDLHKRRAESEQYHEACVLAERNKETGFNIYKGPVVVQRLKRPKSTRKESERERAKDRRYDREMKYQEHGDFDIYSFQMKDIPTSPSSPNYQKRMERMDFHDWSLYKKYMQEQKDRDQAERSTRLFLFRRRIREMEKILQFPLPLPFIKARFDFQQVKKNLELQLAPIWFGRLQQEKNQLAHELDIAKSYALELKHQTQVQQEGFDRLKQVARSLAEKCDQLLFAQRIQVFDQDFAQVMRRHKDEFTMAE